MNRNKQVDILRAVAVVLVLGRHMTPCPPETSNWLASVTHIWFQGGWIGVDLFFVLSGFLVSGLLFREHEKFNELRIGRFLIRRGFKIYPPFWLLIGFTVLMYILRNEHVPRRATICELLFVQNYGFFLWNHTWSLAVEEHFYLLLALGFFWLNRRKSAQPIAIIPVAFVVVALLSLLLRVLGADNSPYGNQTHHFPTHLRLDGLFFGVLLSYAYHRDPMKFLDLAQRYRLLLAGIGGLLLLPAFLLRVESTPFIYTYGLTLFYLGSGCLLVAALGCPSPANRFWSAIAYGGSHSYSVYLWHMPVAIWGTALVSRALGTDNWFVYAATYLVGSIAFGIGMAILTEFPVLRLRDRFFPSRGTPLATEMPTSDATLEKSSANPR